MDYIIEIAEEFDAKKIADIKNYYIENTNIIFTSEKTSEEKIKNDIIFGSDFYLVAKLENKIIGFVGLLNYRSGGYYITKEVSLYIDKDFHKQGIGKSLLKEILIYTKNKNYKNLVAYINSDNINSLNLFKKYGFIESGKLNSIAIKFDTYLDVTILQYKL
ncbi:MAG: GNAT family N-acetyltransferase [Lachnospirales bacterium]